MKLNNYNNADYYPGKKWLIILWFFLNNIFINSYLPIPVFFKIFILKLFKAELGCNIIIKPNVNIKYPWNLKIGNNVWIGENVWIDNLAKVIIGSNVCISQGAMLLCGNHNYKKENFDLLIGSIILKDCVWIGSKAIVCPGVVCEKHSILTVGSVLVTNMIESGIYQGNPAIYKKSRIYEN